jgi:hypothetical protein
MLIGIFVYSYFKTLLMKRTLLVVISVLAALGTQAQVYARIASDNPLKTHTDSVVHYALLKYMRNTQQQHVSVGVYLNGRTFTYNYGRKEQRDSAVVLPSESTVYTPALHAGGDSFPTVKGVLQYLGSQLKATVVTHPVSGGESSYCRLYPGQQAGIILFSDRQQPTLAANLQQTAGTIMEGIGQADL